MTLFTDPALINISMAINILTRDRMPVPAVSQVLSNVMHCGDGTISHKLLHQATGCSKVCELRDFNIIITMAMRGLSSHSGQIITQIQLTLLHNVQPP